MRLACLLLAAGASRRFGGRKQLADLNGKPLLRHALDALQPVFGNDLYCVIGAYADQVRPLVAPQAQVIEHPAWAQGLGSSISHGMAAITRQTGYEGVLLCLGDQVALDQGAYTRLLQQFDPQRIVAAAYAGKTGVPALFPATYFDELMRLSGDTGARALLQRHAEQVIAVPLPEAEIDIDTLEALRSLRQRSTL